MRRMFRRTKMETCPADSAFMDCIDKDLIAQIDIVPNTDGHDTVVEHWSTQADKDADFREAEAYRRNPTPAANPANGTEASAEDARPDVEEYSRVLVFVQGQQVTWGFVKDIGEDGAYTTCTPPDLAFDFEKTANAVSAIQRMRDYEQSRINGNNSFYVLKAVVRLKSEWGQPKTNPGASQKGNG